MRVRQLDTLSPRDIHQFIAFPFELYRDCPQWVPPLWGDMELVFNRRKHPFFRHSAAEFFVAEEDRPTLGRPTLGRRTLGRLAVLDNRVYNEARQKREAFFYYLDMVEDKAVTRALFDAAITWARGRGLENLSGARGFMQGDGQGILIEGFEHRPAVGIPYNYPYYDALLSDAGFLKETDTFSGYLSGTYELPPRFYEIAEKVKERRGLRIRSFTSRRELRAWVPRIGKLVTESFAEHADAWPMTEEEFLIVAERLLSIADPRLIKLVMKGDEMIGFLFAFHDISAAIQRIKGRVWPFGWIALLREFRRTTWLNINGVGLLPQHQGVGANAVLYTEMARSVRDFHFLHADVVQVEEKNRKSLGDMAAIGVQWYKTHRIYTRAI